MNENKITATPEVENDLMVISFSENGINVTYIQVKTSKYKIPWIENLDDQKYDKNDRAAEARNQLFRDIIYTTRGK